MALSSFQLKGWAHFTDCVAAMIAHGETRVSGDRFKRAACENTKLAQRFNDDRWTRAVVFPVFNLKRQPQPARPLFTWQNAHRVHTLRSDLRDQASTSRAHHFRVESLASAAHHFRMRGHSGND